MCAVWCAAFTSVLLKILEAEWPPVTFLHTSVTRALKIIVIITQSLINHMHNRKASIISVCSALSVRTPPCFSSFVVLSVK